MLAHEKMFESYSSSRYKVEVHVMGISVTGTPSLDSPTVKSLNIFQSYFASERLFRIGIPLLCIQEYSTDRKWLIILDTSAEC